MNKRQIKRIERMEEYLDLSRAAVDRLGEALEEYEKIQKKYFALENYYGSVQWMDDYEADEAGRLPADLKRGVLSEDAAYDLITDHIELMTRMQRAVLKNMENQR